VCYLRSKSPAQAEISLTACESLGRSRRRDFVWIYLLRGFVQGELAARARKASHLAEVKWHFDAAEADFRKAENLNRRNPNAEASYVLHVNRGATRLQGKRYGEAIRDFQAAIRLKPDQFNAYWSLAQVYEEQKKYDEAIAQLNRALVSARHQKAGGLRPQLGAIYHNRGKLFLLRQLRASPASSA